MSVWALEVYDTETRDARLRRYTTSEIEAEAWERIPRIDFTDGYGLVFQACRHKPRTPRLREINKYGYREHQAKLRELRREVRAERRAERDE